MSCAVRRVARSSSGAASAIASATVIGESHYELGALRAAVAAYDEAILLGATNSEWLLAVQFPAQGPQPSQRPRVATWGRSARGTKSTTFPDTMTIRQAAADPQKVLQQGGVLAAPVNVPIRPQEIMRALVIALYRRGLILGPLGGEGSAIDEINTALSKRLAPANHWSQAWIDIALGTAARTRVLIDSTDGDEHWGTVGVSDNIIEASWLALVDSFEYKLGKEATKG
jgi:hypothetical protein